MLAFLSLRGDGTPVVAGGRRLSERRVTTVRVRQHVRASAQRVFDAWLDRRTVGNWLFATASQPMAYVELDARVGGRFRLAEHAGDAATTHHGEYVEIDRPLRLVFTLAGPQVPNGRVTVEFAARADGCELLLAHEGVPDSQAQHTEERWTGILYGLHLALARRATATGHADNPIYGMR